MVGGTGEDPRPEMEFCPLTGPLSEEDRFDAQFTDSYSCKPEVIKRTAPVCYYVMNFAEFGEVFRLVELNERLSESLVRFLFKQLVDGLHYLHTRVGVVHRDIKPENLLIDKNLMHLFPEDVQNLLNERLSNIFSPEKPYPTDILEYIQEKFKDWDRYKIKSYLL